ncbi:MAG TPA: hypothetical protein VFA39_17555 [Steroidobacteraceae bacterium]|nr:hypothetical protein [Steroidobacteraceae bacterium]
MSGRRPAGHPSARAAALACVMALASVPTGRAADVGEPAHAPASAASARESRSAALFEQMLPVLEHPRCMNCHTNTGFPRQGDDRHRHIMNVSRGADGHGAVGLRCSTCHQSGNQAASGVPGAPDWHLAPLSMAWEGLTPSQLCRVLFDPRKGGLEPAGLAAHLETSFVRWAWSPGTDAHGRPRSTPPISHRAFVALARRWVATGAVCP